MARRFMDFIAGAAVGAALVAYLKSDKARLASLLDRAEEALTAGDETLRQEGEQEMKQEEGQ